MDKIQILIVEDNYIIAKNLQQSLENMGYSVPSMVTTGSGAIEAVLEYSIDLVLMDIVLQGGMDGIETASRIQSIYKIPVVYLTSHTDEATLKRAKITAPYGYLIKPVSETEIRSTIEMSIYRFRMERELRESNEKYSVLVETAQDGVVIVHDEVFKFANNAMTKIIGYSEEEFIGMHIMDTVEPEYRQMVAEKHKALMDDRPIPAAFEFKILCKDGKTKFIELSAGRIQYKGKPAAMGIMRDITERKKSESELKAAIQKAEDEKARTDAAFEAIGDAVSIQDTEFKIMYQNELHKETLGSHIGKYCFNAYENRDHVCEGCPVAMCYKDGEVYSSERSVTIDNELKTFDITASPIRNASGEIVAGIEIVREITERKIAEDALEKHREQLEALVAKRTAALTEANELLHQEIVEREILEKAILETEERELRRIGCELHDGLGQLLTAVSLKTHSLEEELNEQSIPEAESVERITFLIDKAKEHLRMLMKGNFPMEKDQKNIISLMEELTSRVSRDYKLPCYFTYKPVSIKHEASVMHLYRIAQEAVTNALRHAGAEFIKIDIAQDNNLVTLTVSDNGKGIPKEHNSSRGMGLKIMQYRANMIGASFNISSTENSGTCITCTYDNESIEER